VHETDLFGTFDYDAIVCSEFLEHVKEDLAVLNRIRPGTRFYGTVPNFPFTSHLRHFRNEADVFSRYAPSFTNFGIDTFLGDVEGHSFYLMEGRKL
jgi:hypothetical protein